MKVLVTGAGGMLGTDVRAVLMERGHEVVATGRREGFTPLDVTDTHQTMQVIGAERPEVVLHCAAWTDVDGAERDPDGAYRGNALGAWNVAAAAAETGALMIYVSTDFVFDGAKNAPYTEFDRTNPLGVYGASKEAGEQLVRQTLPDRHIIARTSWLFGRHGKCFPKTVLRLAESKPEVPIVADQIGCPTFTEDLARKLAELAEDPLPGTYHICNAGECSWYEFAQEIVRQAGLSTPVVPITAAEYAARFNSPTRRPAYSPLRRLALQMRGMDDLRDWREALSAFLR
jgi:dTDP-4-dehydrorhamnose reductase